MQLLFILFLKLGLRVSSSKSLPDKIMALPLVCPPRTKSIPLDAPNHHALPCLIFNPNPKQVGRWQYQQCPIYYVQTNHLLPSKLLITDSLVVTTYVLTIATTMDLNQTNQSYTTYSFFKGIHRHEIKFLNNVFTQMVCWKRHIRPIYHHS